MIQRNIKTESERQIRCLLLDERVKEIRAKAKAVTSAEGEEKEEPSPDYYKNGIVAVKIPGRTPVKVALTPYGADLPANWGDDLKPAAAALC